MVLTLLPGGKKLRTALMIPVVHVERTRIVVALHGEADISTRRALGDALSRVIADGAGDVVIDLADATFVDVAVVRVLATAQQLLDRQARVLTVRSPSRLAARVMDAFGLKGLIAAELGPEIERS